MHGVSRKGDHLHWFRMRHALAERRQQKQKQSKPIWTQPVVLARNATAAAPWAGSKPSFMHRAHIKLRSELMMASVFMDKAAMSGLLRVGTGAWILRRQRRWTYAVGKGEATYFGEAGGDDNGCVIANGVRH